MKKVHRILTVLLAAALLPVVASAESRGKSLKRAAKEIRKANFTEAEKIYRGLLEKDQTDKDARLGLSFTLIKQIKLQEAYENAAQVIAADPLNARGFALLGTALLRSGEFRNSVEALYTAVRFNGKEALAIAGLSEIAYYEHRTQNSYEGLKKAISIDPMEPDYYLSLARACSRLEIYNEAADAYQRFLDVTPKTEVERRARIRGLIDFYRYLGNTKIHRTSGKEITTIPFDLVNHRPFITVTVNGGVQLRFVIDTGASLSVVSDTVAERLGVKPIARGGNARAVGGTGMFPIVYGLLDSIAIGEAKIEAVPVYIRTIYSASDTPEIEKADGYIGLSVLANYGVTIDYQAKQMTLDRTPIREEPVKADAAKPAEPSSMAGVVGDLINGFEVPIRSTSGGLASAETHLPNLKRPLNFIIDTGATTTVISKAAVQRNELEELKIKGETIRVIGAAGIEEGVELLGLSALTVNGLRKTNSRAVILSLEAVNETSGFEQHGILGGDYLENFRVAIDLRRFQFKLTPQSKAITVAEKE
ncbi:MAG TPA: aspartyl protease family protein [Blastocatellia bacterium]|nr:aspartyl protease family protein [Blastocatellia bacterium]